MQVVEKSLQAIPIVVENIILVFALSSMVSFSMRLRCKLLKGYFHPPVAVTIL